MQNIRITIFTDGAYWMTRELGFGWVAVQDNRKAIQEAHGAVASDGTGNFGAEAWAILEALQWAFSAGYRAIEICTDFESMPKHIERRGDNEQWHAVSLHDWIAAHPGIEIKLTKASGANPWHLRAHELARAGAEQQHKTMKERISGLYCHLLAYRSVSREVREMPWTSQRLSLMEAELRACRNGQVREADLLLGRRVGMEALLST